MNVLNNKTKMSAKCAFTFKIALTMYAKTNENAYKIGKICAFLTAKSTLPLPSDFMGPILSISVINGQFFFKIYLLF